jgi:hypothetical protein
MPKWFIRFRKKFILPFKWTRKINKEISEFSYPKDTDIYMKMKELENEYLEAEKLEDWDNLKVAKGRIRLFNWFIGK